MLVIQTRYNNAILHIHCLIQMSLYHLTKYTLLATSTDTDVNVGPVNVPVFRKIHLLISRLSSVDPPYSRQSTTD